MIRFILVFLVAGWIHAKEAPNRADLNRKPAQAPAPILEEDTDSINELRLQETKPDFANAEKDPKGIVGLFPNAEAPSVAQLISLARKSVDIEIYEMNDPDVRAAIRTALAAKPKVRVRVLKDPSPVGQRCSPWGNGLNRDPESRSEAALDCLDQQALVREIKAANGEYVEFNKAELCGQEKKVKNCFQHGKMIIVDSDRYALISTGNFNVTSFCNRKAKLKNCNRDYTYITRDRNTIRALFRIFEKDLAGKRYDLREILREEKAENRLTVSPYSHEPLAKFLESAERRIQIQNQYIYPDSGLPEILMKKAQEGVSVEVQLSDVCHRGKVRDSLAYKLHLMFAALEGAGVKIRMFNKKQKIGGRPGYLHAKTIVVDNRRAWVGSINGSWTSINNNREFGIFYAQPARVKSLSQMMNEDFEAESNQTWRDSLQCRQVGYNSKDATRADAAPPVAPANLAPTGKGPESLEEPVVEPQ